MKNFQTERNFKKSCLTNNLLCWKKKDFCILKVVVKVNDTQNINIKKVLLLHFNAKDFLKFLTLVIKSFWIFRSSHRLVSVHLLINLSVLGYTVKKYLVINVHSGKEKSLCFFVFLYITWSISWRTDNQRFDLCYTGILEYALNKCASWC